MGLSGLLEQAPERPGREAGALVRAPQRRPWPPLVTITDIKESSLNTLILQGRGHAKPSADEEYRH